MIVDKAIRIALDKSSPSIKYFLVKWLQEFGPFERVEKSVIAISAELGVSKDVVSKATSYLTTNGYFEKETVLTTKRWSRYSFKCSTKLKNELIDLGDGGNSHHVALIEHLLINDIQRRSGTTVRRHSLDLAPKLLLIILLRNANECGVVDHLGLSALAKLTGLSKESVKARIEHLLKRGYIRSYVPGVTGRHLYHRSPGIIYINLKHQNYAIEQKTGLTTYIQSNSIGRNPNEAMTMFTVAKHILTVHKHDVITVEQSNLIRRNCNNSFFFIPKSEDFIKLAYFFTDPLMYSKLNVFMQAKINGYASALLSEQWNALSQRSVIESDHIKKTIANDTFGKNFNKDSNEGVFPSKQQKEGLVNFLFDTSVALAKRMQGQLNQVTEAKFGNMNHVIIPTLDTGNHRLRVAIDSFPNVNDKYSYNKCIKINADYLEPSKSIVDEEYEISLEDEYNYGLLTKPEKKVFYVGDKTITL